MTSPASTRFAAARETLAEALGTIDRAFDGAANPILDAKNAANGAVRHARESETRIRAVRAKR